MATKQRHTHIVAEEADGRPFERIEESPIKAQTARMVIANCGGRIMRNVYCSKPIAECRKPENLIGGGPPESAPTPGAPLAAPTVTLCRCSRMVDGSCPNLWPGHPAYGTCRCACHADGAPDPHDHAAREAALPPYNPADGAPCAQCGHGQELHVNGTAECWWSSDDTPPVDCSCWRFESHEAPQRADEAELQAGLLATLPVMAGGSGEDTCDYCEQPIPAGTRLTSGMIVFHCAACWDTIPAPGCACDLCCGPEQPPINYTYAPGEKERLEQAYADWARTELAARGWPIMAGGAPTPADDPAGPGATLETYDVSGPMQHYYCPFCRENHYPPLHRYRTPHTHPCPTCHQARACTATGCADGPRECATCSQCRGW